ncbi:thiamine pyrophosphate-binding protein [Herbiconiux sp. CPCC 203407]|uniref:Thiamine pyrophosphate-binding protein n=1 Tax=Herbiconiux oxytropis TaxID=2970915 RepID=A0AA42BWL7_9MICO|nr:thiamine pyrophosphate-binding protein [Herbiconiux oxytropis]MCS5722578.1 thiamine pyrophosphate-binding protein [Herbiconiux oxytropis]MCS5726518.1 thiamine pyrophosphate-binding protein [Herbiconiux oxytropis]
MSRTTESINGAELLVRTLVRLGVEDAFNIVGLGLFPLAEAFYRHRAEVRYISALNETNLGLIAAGYARAKRSASFVNVYHASGTALGMMAVTTAWAESVPLVFTTTTSSRKLEGRDQYAAVPRAVTEMSAQFTKWSAEIPSADRIPEFVERAFQIANTPPYGPVHLAFPMDVWLEQTSDTSAGVAPTEVLADFGPSEAGVAKLAELLRGSEKPLLVAGSELARYGGVAAAVSLAETLGAAVVSEDKISDLGFPTTHEQFVGKLSMNRGLVAESDVVLLLGVELTESGLTAPVDFGDAAVAVLSVDPLLLTRQLRPEVAVLGLPSPTLEAVDAALTDDPIPEERRAAGLEAARARHAARAMRNEEIRAIRFDDAPLAIGRIITELQAVMPPGTIVVNHCASGEPFVEDLIPVEDTDTFFGISSKASAQGWGGPASIGIQLARPDARVVAMLGDGGFMFSSTAIFAAAQFDVPVIFVILNNGGWRDIGALARVAKSPLAEAEAEFGWLFTEPTIDHAAFAASLGLASHRAGTPDELRQALETAFASGKTALIEVMNSPEDANEFSRVFTQSD